MIKTKDFLGLRYVDKNVITEILSLASEMKKIVLSDNKKIDALQGKSIVTLFYENSTRTRTSFELASKYMSSVSENINAAVSSVAKGETLIDTGKTIDRMGTDIIIMRHPMSGAPYLLSKHVKASVVNAGDGMNEHPTQALLDMLTIQEHKGDFKGLKVAIIGDVYHSRVARSNIWGLSKFGADLWLAGPTTLMPAKLENMGVHVTNDINTALKDADVVMGLRIQKERQQKGLFPSLREYSRYFGVNEERLGLAKRDVLVLHPGPVNRGVELSSDVIDGKYSSINEQVTNGVSVRMALLYLLTRSDRNAVTD